MFVRLLFAIQAVCCAATSLQGMPVTGWLRDTSFGGGAAATLTAPNTNSPILGNGTAENADNVAIYAPFPLVSLAEGHQLTLSGSAEMIGTSSVGDFRWGIFKDDGVGSVTAGWLGYLGSAESLVWSKDPAGQNFSTTTFASVAGSPARGFVLGSMSEPNGILFNPGTYDFRMTVQRFGEASEIQIAIINHDSGFSISTPWYSESNLSRLTSSFDRVGFLAGSALNADQIRFGGVDVTAAPISAPTLQVHSSGQVYLTNYTGQTFDLTHYQINSASGALSASGWLSLDDQENNDPLGVGWEEAGGSSANVLAEVNLLGMASLASGGRLRLGSAYSPSGARDLVLRYTTEGDIQRGLVQYVQAGDHNGDGQVNAADYSFWRDSTMDPVGYSDWKANFGTDSLAMAVTVPEPRAFLWGVHLLIAAIAIWQRKRGYLESGLLAMKSGKNMLLRNIYSRQFSVGAVGIVLTVSPLPSTATEINQVAGNLITFNTNGAWSWYMDERVIVDPVGGNILMSSAADVSGTNGAARNGDIDVVSYNLSSGQINQFVLYAGLGADDHNSAALLVRPDGRYLAVYTRHNADKLTHYRVSTNPHDATSWGPDVTFNWASTPNSDFNVTYSNLFYLSAEDRTYNFARANNRSPNMMLSNDDGSSWTYGGKLFYNPVNVGYVNGYFKYASNGVDRIDFIATEHHPRDYNNNIYHGYIQGGQMFRSDGSLVDANIFDNNAPNQTSLTPVFLSDPENGSQVYSRAWTTDLHVDSNGNPYGIFTTRANDVPVNTNGYNDHRFWYARFDGSQWNVHQLAKAGARLYTNEQDYTGLVALDPHNPNRLFISSTIDPRDDTPLKKHEIFQGLTSDGGENWSWTPITYDSEMDNLRPIVPIWDEEHTALVWMRGTYTTQQNYDLDIVGLIGFGPLKGRVVGDLDENDLLDIEDFRIYIAAMFSDLSGMTAEQAYAKGDLNGDFKNDAFDFAIFRKAYDDAHGDGAFNALLIGVPEPPVIFLVGIVFAGLVFWRRSSRSLKLKQSMTY